MTSPDSKVSILLSGGYNERTFPELVSPTVAQGAAPVLVESLNTRHGMIPGTCVRSPLFTNINPGGGAPFGNVGQDCHGVIPCATGKSTAFLFRRSAGGSYSMGDVGRTSFNGPLQSTSDKSKAQSCYLPARISDSGAIPGASSAYPISTSFNKFSGLFWFAYSTPDRTTPSSFNLYVMAFRQDGVLAAPPLLALTIVGASYGWAGLTSHGANGDRLYCGNAGSLQMRSLTITGNIVSVGAPSSLFADPGSSSDVVAIDDNTAALLSASPSSSSDAQLARVNVATNSLAASVTMASYLQGVGYLAVTSEIVAGIAYIATICASTTTGVTHMDVFAAATLASARGTTTVSKWGPVAVRFALSPSIGPRVAFAVTEINGGARFSTTGSIGTGVYAVSPTGSDSYVTVGFLPWTQLANRGSGYRPNSAELYPVFFVSRAYASGIPANDPSSADYVDDPSIDGWMVGSDFELTPIARVGVVRGATLGPARIAYEASLSSAGCIECGPGKMLIAYRKDNFQAAASAAGTYVGRYVVLDMTAHQPAIAHDKDGAALVASAMPVQWDGHELVEMGGPLHSPHIAAATTGGSGTPLAAGAYSFRAVYQWTDAAGLLHRSRPSAPVTLTMSGSTSPLLRVTKPDTMRNGISQAPIEVLVYATVVNLPDYHLMPGSPTAADAFQYTYGVVAPVATSYPQLYSGGTNGEEVVPTPPPPLHDIAIIQSRAWGIDAELRSRLVYSKLRVAGTGFEWAPAYEVPFPSGAGKLMAVRELSGQVVVLAERAVFTVSGDGPSNQIGDRGNFASPVKVSDIGCSNADSVIVTPVGIFWQDGDRVVLMDAGGGVQPIPEIRLPDPVVGALLLRNQREVCFFSSSVAEIRVLSYDQPMRWSKWNSQTLPVAAQCVASLPYDATAAVLYSQTSGTPYRLDAASVSAATSMQWRTDKFCLDGDPQTSVIVRWLIFNGFVAGPHGLVMEIFEDHETIPSTSRTWTAAQIASLADAGGRYTIRLEPKKQLARAIELRFRDDITGQPGSAGVRPRSVTMVFALDGDLHEVAFVAGSTQ